MNRVFTHLPKCREYFDIKAIPIFFPNALLYLFFLLSFNAINLVYMYNFPFSKTLIETFPKYFYLDINFGPVFFTVN